MAEGMSVTGSVRARLARRFAAFGIVAALIASAVGLVVTWGWSTSLEREFVELVAGFEGHTVEARTSTMLSRQLDEFMRERIADVEGWASGPTVVSAARQAHSVHEQSGLLSLNVEDIEKRFLIRKSLGRFPIADDYLRAEIARSEYFDRILVTDRNGFNVVVTNVSSDFVQSDESWWQRTWSDGFAISPVTYADGMGAWVIEISVRVDDPATENPVGVLQAVLSIAVIQEVADWYGGHDDDGQRVTVVNRDGLLLAETSSGHAGSRIMNEKVSLRGGEADARQAALGAEHSGQVIDDEWVTGYSSTAGGEFYADLTRGFRFPGFNWSVIVQSEEAKSHAGAEHASFEDAAMDVITWRETYTLVIGGCFLVLAVLAGGIGWIAAGRSARPIQYLRTTAEQLSQGKDVGSVHLDTNDEFSEIAGALDRLRRTILLAVRIVRERRRGATS